MRTSTLALLLALCLVVGCDDAGGPVRGCAGRGGVAHFEVHDGVGYYYCHDGVVGRD